MRTNVQHEQSTAVRVIEASEADPGELAVLLKEVLGEEMARFLSEHGDWYYRKGTRRCLVTYNGVLAGCSTRIPSVCMFKASELPVEWGAHLRVRSAFRGRGLSRYCIDGFPDNGGLFLSVVTEGGARARQKAGFGIRSDVRIMRVVLEPRQLLGPRAATGLRGVFLRAAALAAAPLAAVYRARAKRFVPKAAEITEAPDPAGLEAVFRRWIPADLVTTCRSSEYLQWRYFDAPYRNDLVFYSAGPREEPTHYAIVRYVAHVGGIRARVLDIFGDFGKMHLVRDLLRTVVRDAARRGAISVEMLSTWPGLTRAAYRVGFVTDYRRARSLAWGCLDPAVHQQMATAWVHWTEGDGDTDHLG